MIYKVPQTRRAGGRWKARNVVGMQRVGSLGTTPVFQR